MSNVEWTINREGLAINSRSFLRVRRLASAALALAMLSFLLPAGALASTHTDNIKADIVRVSVMPEYDDPRVLVIMEPTLSDDTSLPAKARMDVPKSAQKIQVGMACELVDGQQHKCKIYETKDEGDYQRLTYGVETSRQLFFEYYFDPFAGQKVDKSFKYEFRAPYDIKQLEISIQQPLKAENYKIEPAATTTGTDNQGMKTYQYTFENITEGQVLGFDVSYKKTDPNPSVEKPNPNQQNQNTSGTQTSGGLGTQGVQLGILAIAGLIGLGIVVSVWRVKSLNAAAAAVTTAGKPKAKPKSGKAKAAGSKGGSAAKFCSECGAQVTAGAKFCADCGERL